MDDIRRLLSAASRRLVIADFLRTLVSLLTAASVVVLAAVAIEKLGPWTFRWPVLAGVALGLPVFGAAVTAWWRRERGVALADEVDRRAGLRETLSTSMAMAGRSDAWSAAVTKSAGERARRVVLRDAVPVAVPSGWRVPAVIAGVAVVGLWLAPRHDLTGLLARDQADEQQQAEIRATALEIESGEDRLREILENAPAEFEKDRQGLDEPAEQGEPKSAEELKRAALKKLTKLNDDLNQLKQGESAKSLEAIQESVRRLKTPGPGPAEEFARSLARGQFADAKDALEKLAAELESGSMSEEARRQAAAQLESLAEQMEKLAARTEALKRALEKAGMSSEQAASLANDPSGLQEALSQTPGLSRSQIESLTRMAQSQQSANQAMQSMALAMSEMAQQMQSGQMSQQAMQQMSQQLSRCEMARCEMQSINRALSECRGQMRALGQSMCEGGGSDMRIGSGDGGSDYDPDAPPADDYMRRREKTDVANLGGPVIGSTLVYGAQVRGEAQARFGEVVGASAVEAAEAIESMRVPREYHDAVRHYFGRLEATAASEGAEKSDG